MVYGGMGPRIYSFEITDFNIGNSLTFRFITQLSIIYKHTNTYVRLSLYIYFGIELTPFGAKVVKEL